MSVLTGCIKGAEATGLVHENVRSDAYKELLTVMETSVKGSDTVSRKNAKDACMTLNIGVTV